MIKNPLAMQETQETKQNLKRQIIKKKRKFNSVCCP